MNIFKEKSFEPFLWFLYAAAAFSAACFLVYGGVQQSYRQSLNDPQIQMTEDAALSLERSAAILDLVPAEKVVIEDSLKVFINFYDTEGNPIAGNGYLNGKLLDVPKGVFDDAKAWGKNLRTLQPQPDVRIAVVVKPFVGRETSGFVLSGRTMRVVEGRIHILGLQVLFGWSMTLGALFVLSLILWFLRRG